MAIDFTTDVGKVRLLLNDVDETRLVFSDPEVQAFLDLEGGNVKHAAAQAIDTNADDQVLASKVLKSKDLSTDGAKVAEALHKRATELRRQADKEADDGFFDVINFDPYADGTVGFQMF